MMNPQIKAITAMAIPCLFLGACGSSESVEEAVEISPSGAKSAIATMHLIAQRTVKPSRPSAPLGVFVGLYASQGGILAVQSASNGFDAIAAITEGQTQSTSNENFALLREVGDVLQVDIVDALNRATDRSAFLDEYIQSLKNTGILVERKIAELDALVDSQKQQSREDRDAVRSIEKKLKSALKRQDYGEAASYEEGLAQANATYAEISTKAEQTRDMLKRFEGLLNITAERYQALSNNREILIAGLKVFRLPGISDLNILEEGKSWRKQRGRRIFSSGE